MEKNGVNSKGQVVTAKIEIACAVIKEKSNELQNGQKAGEATEVIGAGKKDNHDIEQAVGNAIQELINMNVQTHECGYDSETGLSIRIIDGQVVKVNKKLMKEIKEKREKTGKTIKTVKGPNIKKEQTKKQDELDR